MKSSDLIRCVVDAGASLGEGTYWDQRTQYLWWIDIFDRKIHRYLPAADRSETYATPGMPGCLAVRAQGGLILSMGSGFYLFDPATAEFEVIADPESHLKDTRFNDGKTDRQGRFWSGSMFEASGAPCKTGSLYRLDADRSCHRMIQGIGCSNGLAWSPDSKVMYHTDSHGPIVWAWDFDAATGTIARQRIFVDLSADLGAPDAFADGATVDAEGCYWLTVPYRGKILRYDPSGRLMRTIKLPVDLPTCCEFGGPNLDVLYVTTATLRRTPDKLAGQSHPGGLFAVDVGVKGLAAVPFQG